MMTRGTLSRFLLLSACSIPLLAHAAEGGQWEYHVAQGLEDLNKPLKDPTNDCKEGVALSVLGRMGWELVSVYSDGRRQDAEAKGTILLQAEKPGYPRQGTLQFGIRTSERVTAIFKRPLSHTMRGKHC